MFIHVCVCVCVFVCVMYLCIYAIACAVYQGGFFFVLNTTLNKVALFFGIQRTVCVGMSIYLIRTCACVCVCWCVCAVWYLIVC